MSHECETLKHDHKMQLHFFSIIYNFLGHHICFVVHVIEGCAGVLCSCVSKGVLHEPQMFQICALVVWCELTMCTFPVFIVEVWRNKGIAYYILLFVCRWHTTHATLSWRCIMMSDTVARYKKSVRRWTCVCFYFCQVINLILVDYKVHWYFCRFWSLYAPAFTSLWGGTWSVPTTQMW